MVRYTATAVLKSGASPVTANGQSNGVDVSRFAEGLLLVNTTAASGTNPTLNLFVDTYDPVNNLWFQLPVSVPQITSASNTWTQLVQLTNFGQQIRLRWQVGGTSPSFTFTAVFVAKS